ncbi:sugar ABC transporter permease [Paenibacillus agaridevorans]|uniref:Sugar ABC transporter permease n=2 Tax=Paenibacillus TaxID=44249 RepID=A0A2R5EKH1_9BACL|nr:sugar ABC transporter permease [Paenibacillus agaridevorans]
MLRTVFLSFMETNAIATQMQFVGLGNYSDMTSDRHFWRVVGNTAIYGFSQVILTLGLGLLFAAVANSNMVKFRTLFRLSAFYPYVLPIAVAAMVWIYLYNPSRGAINLLLDHRIQWLNSYEYALIALIIVSVWKSLGFSFLLILAGMQNISKEYYEAAALETNNHVKRYFMLTLPMLMPTLFVVCLLCVTSSFQSMDLVAIMTQGGPGHSSNVLMYYIYQEGIINRRLGYGSAMSTIFLLVLVAFTIVYLKFGERRVEYER